MRIRSKLFLNILITILCLVIVGGAGYFFMNRVANVSMSLFEEEALPVIKINEIEKTAWEVFIRYVVHSSVSEYETMDLLEQQITGLNEQIVEHIKEYEQMESGEEHSTMWQAFQKEWGEFHKIGQEVLALSQDFTKEEALNLIVGEGRTAYDKVLSTLRTNVEAHEQHMSVLSSEAKAARWNSMILIVTFTALAGLSAVIGGWLITRNISSSLGVAIDIADQLSEGNLDVEIRMNKKDEIGQLLSVMQRTVEKLKGVVSHVKNAGNNVASGSQGMSSSAAQMSQGATAQAAAAEEASSSMEQMVANIRQNADNALQTEKIAVKAAQDATEGGKAVMDAVAAMQEIAKKITVVEDITRQTRMLSLNATIEAARAQEQGKGFAVVASEVRALAERSQTAATEINQLANSSVAIVEKAGGMLAKLVPDIQKTAELVQEISAASKEQNSGAEQINRAIQQLDQVTQQNSATSEEMASMAEELASQAEQLRNTTAFFRTDETAWKTRVDGNYGMSADRTRPAARTKAKVADHNAVETANAGGDGKPAGPVFFHMEPKDAPEDERDAEFERY